MSHNFVCLFNLRHFYVTQRFMPVEHIVNCRWFFVEKFPKPGLLGRILWGFGEAHPTGDSWNDAMRHWPEEFIWKIELLMIVENPTRNLSRKSSTTFVGLAKKAAGGPPDHWCLVTNCWTLVSVHCLHNVLSSSGEFRKSIRVFADLYLQVLASAHHYLEVTLVWVFRDPWAPRWLRPLGSSTPISVYWNTGVLVYWCIEILEYWCTYIPWARVSEVPRGPNKPNSAANPSFILQMSTFSIHLSCLSLFLFAILSSSI